MDFSFILVIGVSAILVSAMMVYSEVTSRRYSIFRLSFGICYLIGIVLMQPWRIASTQEVGMSIIILVFGAIWVALGCIIGAVPTALGIALVKWIRATLRRT